MSPHTRIAALAVAAAALVAGCSNYTTSSDVARVDDETLSIDELRDLMPAFTGTTDVNDVGNGEAARTTIHFWVSSEIARSSLDGVSISVAQGLIDEARQSFEGAEGVDNIPSAGLDLLADIDATLATFLELPMARETFSSAATDVDIYVSPRFGTFAPPLPGQGPLDALTVVPLQ